MAEKPRGSMHILIIHFNTPQLTAQLVKEIPLETPHGRQIRIHILDNCSAAHNVARLKAELTGIQNLTLKVGPNIGYGEGLNTLAGVDEIVDSDLVWVLNPDTRIQPGCIGALERAVDLSDFAVVSPLIFSGETGGQWIWYCGGSVSQPGFRPQHHMYGSPVQEAPIEAFETEFITGAAPMMTAATFRAIGGFPAGYFLYWEDVFFSWKARQLGFRLGVCPTARLWHAVGASSGSGQSSTYYYWATRNRFIFASDIGISPRRLALGRGGLESLRPFAKALLSERTDRLSKLTSAYRGTVDGFRLAQRAQIRSKPHLQSP